MKGILGTVLKNKFLDKRVTFFVFLDMKYVKGNDRDQIALIPSSLEELIDENTSDKYSLWTYSVNNNDPHYGFINQFLNILEPNFLELEKIGINC